MNFTRGTLATLILAHLIEEFPYEKPTHRYFQEFLNNWLVFIKASFLVKIYHPGNIQIKSFARLALPFNLNLPGNIKLNSFSKSKFILIFKINLISKIEINFNLKLKIKIWPLGQF